MLVDDTHAVMDSRELETLPDYSCSVPTGTTIGKRWKRSEFFGDIRPGPVPGKGRWFMGEYVGENEPGCVGIQWREILVVDDVVRA